jgi:hypothetical protein
VIIVIIPSRGRPERARDVLDAVRSTAVLPDTQAVVIADTDDPEYGRYQMMIGLARGSEQLRGLAPHESGNLVKATNTASIRAARVHPNAIIANWGDDHMPRTLGWDKRVTEALLTPGVAYGDDLLQGEDLPTAPFISAAIVNALGWYMLPSLEHMYVDDCWKALGTALGCLIYLPEVVVEHMHPGAGKAESDAGYLRADASTERDRVAFQAWLADGLAGDVARVQDALAVAA